MSCQSFGQKSLFILIFATIIGLAVISPYHNVYGQGSESVPGGEGSGNTPSNPSVDAVKSYKLPDPLGNNGEISTVVNKLIKGVLGVIGVLALIAFIWGGVLWMISMGDEAKIKKGKEMMIYAVWGIVVIFGAYAILDLVLRALGANS